MKNNQPTAKNIDEYIAYFSKDIQKQLQSIRELIAKNSPGATEKISYGIPTFSLHGNLVHFAAYQDHLGVYPGSSAIIHFAKDLQTYDIAKGTIRLPLDQAIPTKLLTKIIQYCVEANIEKYMNKKSKK
jgi:uncharacterized protein YdhG (YjbR/CyaY superfamily)